jgi:hypothetical protein
MESMNQNSELKKPLLFLIGILALEGLLAILLGMGWFWGGVLLFILISSIQIISLMLIWYIFRLLLKISLRLKELETKNENDLK